jgi:tRNA(adenine34) deaminase
MSAPRRGAGVNRRTAMAAALAGCSGAVRPQAQAEQRWLEAAEAMRQRALSWGDQPYGAVLVLDGAIVGEGPSRVVLNNDPDAHAEREAIRDAQQRLGRQRLAGSVLYSTSRPCALCREAASRAGVSRMVFGVQVGAAARS